MERKLVTFLLKNKVVTALTTKENPDENLSLKNGDQEKNPKPETQNSALQVKEELGEKVPLRKPDQEGNSKLETEDAELEMKEKLDEKKPETQNSALQIKEESDENVPLIKPDQEENSKLKTQDIELQMEEKLDENVALIISEQEGNEKLETQDAKLQLELEEPNENIPLIKSNQEGNSKLETQDAKLQMEQETNENLFVKKSDQERDSEPENSQQLQIVEAKNADGSNDQPETNQQTKKSTNARQTYGCHQGFNSILGLVALIYGIMYVNSSSCPWCPRLPQFLVAFGFVTNLGPLVASFVLCYFFLPGDERRDGALSFINHAFGVMIKGVLAWGFILLEANPEEVTYIEFEPNSTVVNRNYCNEDVYLVPMVITWLSVIEHFIFYIVIGLICLCGLSCACCCGISTCCCRD